MTATQADADTGLQLGALLQIQASIETAAEQMRVQNARYQALAQAIRVIPNIPVGQISTTNGNVNRPEVSGPRTGWAWQVTRITVNTFTAGTVQCYIDSKDSPNNLVIPFPSAGVTEPSNLYLLDGHWLVFAATTITGNADISIGVIEIDQRWLGAYLL